MLVVPTLRDTKVVEEFPVAVAVEADGATDHGAGEHDHPDDHHAARARRRSRSPPARCEGIDHDASGAASIFRQPNGTAVVALEGIDIEPGPDYRVIVVRGTDQESPGDGLELDALRGNQGTQYYEVPSGTDPGEGWTVLIWCRAFGVPVANASQRAV